MKKFLTMFGVVLLLTAACEEAPPPSVEKEKATQQITGAEEKGQEVWPFGLEDELQAPKAAMTSADDLAARNFVLIFDDSGSMNDVKCSAGKRKVDAAKAAVVEWSQTMSEGANLGLVTFHSGNWPLQSPTSSRMTEFIKVVESINAGGGTPLTASVRNAFMMLTEQGLRQLGYGEYTIVVVTDGEADHMRKLKKRIQYILDNSPVQIHTIGFCIGNDHTLNQTGRTVYKAATNPEELRQGLQEVLAEAEEFDVSDFK
jgi:Ca-activated chloride channel family protein